VKNIDAIIVPGGRDFRHASTPASLAELLNTNLIIIRGRSIAGARNEGLKIARSCGWNSVFFLDDDIGFEAPCCSSALIRDRIRNNIRSLIDVQAISFPVSEFPDNSVVRHAERSTGVSVDVHPCGGVLLVNVPSIPRTRWFPEIYNDDWFFLHNLDVGEDRGFSTQMPYDPFVPGRAAREEFGDLIAEALYADTTGAAFEGDTGFWRSAIEKRHELISGIIDKHPAENIITTLKKAQESLNLVTIEMIRSFLREWQNTCL
jgi:glycosyltransferase involved in cell wall biosynthesis